MWWRHHEGVAAGVIDVGSNTVRVVVVRDGHELVSQREMLRLGASIERTGSIPPEKLDEAAAVVARFADQARAAGADHLQILITSPGRQAANGDELAEVLERAGRCETRILTAVEEGLLAFKGALDAASPPSRRLVAVVDVGGGSAQVVVGTRRSGALWARSVDIGSQRLTSRLLEGDPPGPEAVAAARAEVEHHLEGFEPPVPMLAFAVGGSARALRRLGGRRLDEEGLEESIALLSTTTTRRLIDRHGVDPERVRTMTAGAVILAALQRRLDTPLKVVRAGLREGALAELAATRAAA
jgi:exopolyphosphatase/guanosine-5'-triphosphate,3'-diphosphate pyrophosphatase